MLRELLTPRPTECFLQYRMTNVTRRPSAASVHVGGASLTRSHDYRSRRGHGERSRISTRLSSCNSQEFIIGKGSREEREDRSFAAAQYRVSVRRISYKSERRRHRRWPGGSGINTRRPSVGRSGKAIFWRIWLNLRQRAHSTSRAVQCGAAGSLCNSSTLALIPSCALRTPSLPRRDRKWSQFDFHLMDRRIRLQTRAAS